MNNHRRMWGIFILFVLAALSAMGWLTSEVLALARDERLARDAVRLDNAIRTALWRMDSTLGPLVAAAPDADAKDALPIAHRLTMPYPAADQNASAQEIAARTAAHGLDLAPPSQRVDDIAFPVQGGGFDFKARSQLATNASNLAQQVQSSTSQQSSVSQQEADVVGPLRAAWLGSKLSLLRRARHHGNERLEVLTVDWPPLSRRLDVLIGDLLPDARLERTDEAGLGGPMTYPLATLPISLIPGPVANPDAQAGESVGRRSIDITLVTAWVCVIATIAALGALAAGAVALSERRATFVSAVTHELRTPITSLRLYADMLSEGMVEDAATRMEYLATIRAEAERLGRLVENVLAVARLERPGPHAATIMPLVAVLAPIRALLERRARDARMEVQLDVNAHGSALVSVDPTGVERILFNLVDNACKYASAAVDRGIRFRTLASGSRIGIEVSDHGPGVPADMQARLFMPFSRSAAEAAGAAPGVGLGLALSRRLARSMGGDLVLSANQGGATFILWLATTG